ncbi:MAG: hypothetical protein ISP49_15085 [Reyranella sp.]|jgi:hypothetical protein|nr:hypothetical protein [Reyranella sp.]MBL6652919.1 hypothetical protein [Reyranella sp.]
MKVSLKTLSLCLFAFALAPAAYAQGFKVDVSATTGSPEFRDPKTGQVWTPETVGQDGKPIGPEDAAFDPSAQNVPTQLVLQKVTARPVGSVPITAGPTVPIVVMENVTLRAVPGQRWQLVGYLNNNSGNAVSPTLDCQFTNAGKPVTTTRATVSTLGPGVRAGVAVMGPRVTTFVDKATCQVNLPS